MSFSTLPLSYCTNVHPGQSIAEIDNGLDQYTVAVQQKLNRPLAAGLWLAQPVTTELLQSERSLAEFTERLQQRELTCYTLNAFPYGDFHSERVKENVYIPDWSKPERLEYTHDCARILSALMPEGTEGSISTVPLGFKEFTHPDDFLGQAGEQLIELARRLDTLYDETGKLIRLAIEPEPFCLLETTDEAITFFETLWQQADACGAGDVVRRTLGLCYDVCHQAVEFEDVGESIQRLNNAGVRINKVHITCAVELKNPAENEEGRRALAKYVEPRYLHQTMARTSDGRVLRYVDLSSQLALEPDEDFLNADVWRIHFHVPVDAESLGPLGTTRTELREGLAAVAALQYAPHLEVETYTWQVLPGEQGSDLVDGLTRELSATHELLSQV
ncbi:MAG: metabolite traffic protein EboE [Planctomycetaceae bacterium]|jgi:sugar phosphate isomerase/epimerase|nr:metabolite traffic protein EboE [Planctomycetaceae bacterium]MBT6157857.1 metabolite traffic protein EboE [Planctomycetaceae bacterium]MBT6487073.1 metabolite traffic protein EboE [Planctomycetaceae bacterium]MBT6493286.1 metabolite traffic protein EboE [Planctomycetaceae bacterium]